MASPEFDLTETHLLGAGSGVIGVRVDKQDSRDWMKELAVCSVLNQHQIAHAGICHAESPFRIVRTQQSGSYFLACIEGEGRILIDGRWQKCRAGTACLLPPRHLNAFYVEAGNVWSFAWVRYQQPEEQRPIATSNSPVLARFNAEPLHAAITGLYHECNDAAAPAQMHHWVELIQSYVMRFARPLQSDDRLWRLWNRVSTRLNANWTVDSLARESQLSGEHLRRLCRKQLGRSPMQHVTFLRMQRAGELLSTTDDKVETIDTAIGYENPFVFSTTFKKWTGWRPTEFRARGQ